MPLDREQRAAIYAAYLNRDGPRHLGDVEWPKARAGVLDGQNFLSTGVFETITREDLHQLIKGSGGRVMTVLSKKLTYLLVGRDAGPVKLQKAEEMGIPQIGEEEFLQYFLSRISDDTNHAELHEENPSIPSKKSKKNQATVGKKIKADPEEHPAPSTSKVAKKKSKVDSDDDEVSGGDKKRKKKSTKAAAPLKKDKRVKKQK